MVSLSVVLTGATVANAITQLPDGVTCTDLYWDTKDRINPVELSDYQKCVIETTTDKDSGITAGILWVKIDGEYYSVHTRLIRKSFPTVEKGIAAFKTRIMQQLKENNDEGS